MSIKKTILITAFLTLSANALMGQFQTNPLDNFWADPEWQEMFANSYIPLADGEPKPDEDDQTYFNENIKPLLPGDVAGAASTLEAYLNRRGNDASSPLLFTLGNFYFQLGNLSKASTYYQRAISKSESFIRANRNLGLVYFLQRNYPTAEKHIASAISAGDTSGAAFGVLGYLQYQQGKYLSAETALRQAILSDAQNDDWQWLYANALYMQEKYNDANTMVSSMLANAPDSGDLWILQGQIHMGLKENNKALADLVMAEQLGQATADSYLLMGDLYLAKERSDLALEAYLKAIQKDSSHKPDPFIKAAEIMVENEAFNNASKLINAVGNTMRNLLDTSLSARIDILRTQIAASTQKGEVDVAKLEKIIREDPLNGQALINLGRAYAAAGEKQRAILLFERAQELDSFRRDAFIEQAYLLVAQKEWADAVSLLRQAQNIQFDENLQKYLNQVDLVNRASNN